MSVEGKAANEKGCEICSYEMQDGKFVEMNKGLRFI